MEMNFYPDPKQKAAALLESILINHPFIDGNKRTGYTLMRLYLMRNHLNIRATGDEKYELVVGAASGTLRYDDIPEGLNSHT